jgi:hypothetical protein
MDQLLVLMLGSSTIPLVTNNILFVWEYVQPTPPLACQVLETQFYQITSYFKDKTFEVFGCLCYYSQQPVTSKFTQMSSSA